MKIVSVLATLVLSAAMANAQPGPQPIPIPTPSPVIVPYPVPVPIPLPSNGCVWAGRPFSDGAAFCYGKGNQLRCVSGKWDPQGTEACSGSTPIDPK